MIWWCDEAIKKARYSISSSPSYHCIIVALNYRVNAQSSYCVSFHRTIVLLRQLSSHNRVVITLMHYRHRIIASLLHWCKPRFCNGATVNNMAISWFDRSRTFTKCLKYFSRSVTAFPIRGEHSTSNLLSYSSLTIMYLNTYRYLRPNWPISGSFWDIHCFSSKVLISAK